MSTPSSALPAATRLGRAALVVSDLDATAAFYRDVVGLEVLRRERTEATLGVDGTPSLVLTADDDARPRDRAAAGLFHSAFRVPSRGALGAALTRIRDRWDLEGASDHLVSEALYLRDPEGNGVEIYRDRDRSEWPTTDDGRVAMVTDPLDLDDLATEVTGGEAAPAETDVGHVHLEVTSLDAARAFYADALGMAVRQEMDGALFLAAGEYHHHVGCNVWNRRSAPAEGRGLDWYEVVVPGEALAAARDRFERTGIEPVATDAADEGDGFTVADPDGIELRVRAGVRN
jgi:catechol 2,3-dioxygenase